MLTEAKLREIIAETADTVDASAVGLTQAFGDAGLDSLDHSSILLAVQEETGVEVPDEEVNRCNSIQAILDFVNARV